MLIDEGLELLDDAQCEQLLGSRGVGRVGITMAGLPVIMPVNYAFVDGEIVFRTGPGSKLHAASNRAVIAFEVDDYDETARSGWSVLAIGRCATIEEPSERAAFEQRAPAAWVPGDRDHYVRLRPELLTGRRIVGM